MFKMDFIKARGAYIIAEREYMDVEEEIKKSEQAFCEKNGYHFPIYTIDNYEEFEKASVEFQRIIDENGLQEKVNQSRSDFNVATDYMLDMCMALIPDKHRVEREVLRKKCRQNVVEAKKVIDMALVLDAETIPF